MLPLGFFFFRDVHVCVYLFNFKQILDFLNLLNFSRRKMNYFTNICTQFSYKIFHF